VVSVAEMTVSASVDPLWQLISSVLALAVAVRHISPLCSSAVVVAAAAAAVVTAVAVAGSPDRCRKQRRLWSGLQCAAAAAADAIKVKLQCRLQ